eukprot:jgi/Bigna1/87763/estExt_fgenesh1_pg.C_240006
MASPRQEGANDTRNESTAMHSQISSSSSKDSKSSSFVFSCKVTDSEYFTTILSVLQMEKDKQGAVFMIADEGIKVTIEKDKILQASAYMKSNIFQEYKLSGGDEKDREFRIDLTTMLDCLRIFSSSCYVTMTYNGYGEDVHLILENKGVITECAIRTVQGPRPVDFNFRKSMLLNQACLKSKYLQDCFSELDIPGTSSVQIVMAPSEPFMSFRAGGDSMFCRIDFPNDELSEVFEHFQCQEYCSNRYNIGLIQMCAKSLTKMPKTDTTMIQMNAMGMLKLQHIVRDRNGSTNFISYLIVPEEGDDDEYEDQEEDHSLGNNYNDGGGGLSFSLNLT